LNEAGARPLSPNEQQLLEVLLAHDVENAGQLRSQLAHARVVTSCACGCGSIGFVEMESDTHRTRPAALPFPVEGQVLNESGALVGGLILFVQDGQLHDLEVFSYGDPLPFPDPANVRWTVRR
jgi:hypothetical protein